MFFPHIFITIKPLDIVKKTAFELMWLLFFSLFIKFLIVLEDIVALLIPRLFQFFSGDDCGWIV